DFSASGPGEHLSFILYKENKDTMECLNQLARVTGTLSTAYTFAGTKDKRGVTVQKCSGYRVYQSKLEGAYLGPGVKIGGFKYVKDRVNLGDLSGNEFVITLRDVALATDHETETDIPKILETSLTSLAESGFINYYGMQRFGTRNISTHQVGLAMLASSWETAVDIIMMPKGDEKPDFVAARNLWMEKRDYKECLKVFPRSCIAERAILTAMQKSKRSDDYYGALQAIPRNLRLMYLHAVQSFVWNHAASERIRLYGNKVVKGDLVAKFNPLAQSNASKVTPEDTGDAEAAEITAIEEHRQGRMIEVELVETDEQAATKSIEDLVLPLPGHAVKYPTNEIGEFYKSFMAKYGLDPHDMKRKQRETSLTGDYRRVIIKPKNVSWKSLRYDDPNFPLSMTDLDRINGAPEPVSIPDGKRLGVIVSFTLETSSYATMALREILRSDTGAGFQSVMSNKSKVETDAERTALEDSA
ncbi:pseudouridine synthase, partial [Rhizoclosmatium globosum]